MIRKILKTSDPQLRTVAKPVNNANKKLLTLLRDMEETLDAQNDPEGLGLAAPQVGVFQRLFVLKPPKSKLQVFINPEIFSLSKKTNDVVKMVNGKRKTEPTPMMEGCLSLPHYYGPIQRAHSVTLKYYDIQPTTHNLILHKKTFTGFLAHIIQHEIDHLNGVFFIDHLLKTGRKLYQIKNKEWFEVKLV